MASNLRKLTIKDILGASGGNMTMEWILDNVCLIFLEVIMFIEVSRMMPLLGDACKPFKFGNLDICSIFSNKCVKN